MGRFITAALTGAGWSVLGPATDCASALAAVRGEQFDIAILDRMLRGDDALAIADAVIARGAPCLLISGHPRSSLPARFYDLPFLEKPFTMDALLAALAAAANAPR